MGNPHAIIFPLPYQGHINPFVNLTIKLASKGFTITFVHTEYIHHTLTKANEDEDDFFSKARKSGLDIRYATISDGFPVEFDRLLNLEEYWQSLINDFPSRVDEFIGKTLVQSNRSLVTFLIVDSFWPWAATIAKKHNLANVSFFTQPALVYTIGYHWNLITENGHYPCKENTEEEINYIPGVDSMNTKDLMSYFYESETSTAVHKGVFLSFESMKKADFVLHYTVQELEPNTLEALTKNQKTYAVGPINSFTNSPKTTITKSLRSESDCTTWLDSKPTDSVLYVSFGSVVQTSKQVIQEIAHGLLLSGVNFLWVVRENIVKSDDDVNIFPTGFVDEIKDRGLIVPWCNQIDVLTNAAVGGFLTHCGWNSTFEGMWCGVSMICYPVTYDQPASRKLVVDDLKIGINLYDLKSITREEVAGNVRNFMSGIGDFEAVRREAKRVKTMLRSAMEINGSSERNFDRFIRDLKEKIY